MPGSTKFAPLPGYSRSAIDRAGEELKRWWLDTEEDGPASVETIAAFATMIAFREAFQLPLKKTVMGLKSMVRSECPELKEPGARVPVAQRLKRREQIINKLARLDSMRLWTMGDIGKEHEWALVVERTGARLGIGLKEGEGPDDLKEYFRLASLGMYMERMSQQPDSRFVEAFDAARRRALPYFRR